jgi:hypothetical protein
MRSMTLTMSEEQAIIHLAGLLYSYLPASGAPITFREAATAAGVGEFWTGGAGGLSKRPAITQLLRATLDTRRDRFCSLIEHIVRRGLAYRDVKGNPLTRKDIETLNSAIQKVGFKIPELWSPKFLSDLPQAEEPARPSENQPEQPPSEPDHRLAELRAEFLELYALSDRQKAGLKLEPLLTRLFALFDLAPSRPFRVVGEQIDGAFNLDQNVYLVEAKWTRDQVNESALLVLRGKIEGKSQFTRGLFLSINGYSSEALAAITKGKQQTFIMMDGAHLFRVLEGHVRLDDLLRRLVRHLAETGEPYLPVGRF